MIKHILANGKEVESVTGMEIRQEDVPEVYRVKEEIESSVSQ